MQYNKHIVILGAGISGLTLAYYLKKEDKKCRVTILEKKEEAGGLILPEQEKSFFFESAARAVSPSGLGSYFIDLVYSLGLEDEIIGAKKSSKKRYIFYQNTLKQVPQHFKMTLAKALLQDLFTRQEVKEESVYAFAEKRFGKECASILVDAMVCGIYGRSSKELSLEGCFPRWKELERKNGSLVLGLIKERFKKKKNAFKDYHLLSFKNGLFTLIEALKKAVKDSLFLEMPCVKLQFKEKVHVFLKNGEVIEADHVVSTLCPEDLIEIVPPSVASLFHGMEMTTLYSAHVGFKKKIALKEGFGYLVPSIEKEPILGCLFDSQVFEAHNRHKEETRLTFMSNKPFTNPFFYKDILSSHLGIKEIPDAIYYQEAKKAIPYFTQDFVQKRKIAISTVEDRSFKITFLGTAFKGVGIANCIAHSHKTAKMLCLN